VRHSLHRKGTVGLPGLILQVLMTVACSGSPDVFIITLDTTRADHLGVYGYERGVTPELDRFASDAVVYRRAWSTSAWTLPAHASILTGKHPTNHGAHFNAASGEANLGEVVSQPLSQTTAGPVSLIKVNRLGEQEVTVAELLAARGYETGAFVGGPWLTAPFGALQGYDEQNADIADINGRDAAELTDAAVAWLQSRPRGKSVHLLLNYFDPHAPHRSHPEYGELPPITLPPPNRSHAVALGTLSPDERALRIDGYDYELRHMDHHFGRLIQELRQMNRYDDALIIVVGDHGEAFGEHGYVDHTYWLYEEILRVPLIVRFPGGSRSGQVSDDAVSVVDLVPMIAQVTGVPIPEGVDGVVFGTRDVAVAEVYRDALAISGPYGSIFDRDLFAAIHWPWKLIVSDTGAIALYRLDRDPLELENRADGKEEQELLRRLTSLREGFEPPGHLAPPTGVDPATRRRLGELGYIE